MDLISETHAITNDVPEVLGAKIRGYTVHKFLVRCKPCSQISLSPGKEPKR